MVTVLVSTKYYLPDLELPCGHPGDIEHGLTDWNGTGRAVARYACYQGYYLVGPPRLVSSSVWKLDLPTKLREVSQYPYNVCCQL